MGFGGYDAEGDGDASASRRKRKPAGASPELRRMILAMRATVRG